MRAINVGDWVIAAEQISEEDFNGAPLWIHADVGEPGQVVGLSGEWLTIIWAGTRTTIDCHPSEVFFLHRNYGATHRFQIPDSRDRGSEPRQTVFPVRFPRC